MARKNRYRFRKNLGFKKALRETVAACVILGFLGIFVAGGAILVQGEGVPDAACVPGAKVMTTFGPDRSC